MKTLVHSIAPRRRVDHRGLLLATLALAGSCLAEPVSDVRYVTAHRVNLREGPSAAAAVVRRLAIGVPVQLQSRSGSWCAVATVAPATSGFMACQWLAETPPRIRDLDGQRLERVHAGATPDVLLPLDERAFWLSPSLQRWASFAHDQPATGVRDGLVVADVPHRVVPSESFSASLMLLASGSMIVRDLVDAPDPSPLAPEFVYLLQSIPLPPGKSSWSNSAACRRR